MTFCTVSDPTAVVAVASRVKTWFIVRRLFEPEEPTDVLPSSGGDGDAAPHIAVKVENAVMDGGLTTEVMLHTFFY